MAGPRSELASLLHDQNGDAQEIRQLREEEAELMERDAKLAPGNGQIHYQLGLLRYLLGQFDEAEAALESACQKSPQNYQYRMAVALLHAKRYELTGDEAQFDAAVHSIKALHEMQPRDPRARQIFIDLLGERDKKRTGTQTPPQSPQG